MGGLYDSVRPVGHLGRYPLRAWSVRDICTLFNSEEENIAYCRDGVVRNP
jgi:hypothetical protein